MNYIVNALHHPPKKRGKKGEIAKRLVASRPSSAASTSSQDDSEADFKTPSSALSIARPCSSLSTNSDAVTDISTLTDCPTNPEIEKIGEKSVSKSDDQKSSDSKRLIRSSADDQKPSTSKPLSTSARKIQQYVGSQLQNNSTTSHLSPVYFLADPRELQKLFENVKCPMCNASSFTLKFADIHYGFAESVSLYCDNCAKTVRKVYSSSRLMMENSERPPFHVNKKMVETFVGLGLGHAGMERMSLSMNMSVMSRTSFANHLDLVSKDASVFSKEMLQSARNIVRDAHLGLDPEIATSGDNIIDITVSYDGSWQRRGFSSIYGLGAVIDVLTGLVIDYVILSKLCVECEKVASDLGRDSAEFDLWYSGHKSCCEKNYSGSSPAMERSAAEILWRRSIQDCSMRYTVTIGDGDTKTVKSLNDNQVYDTTIDKLECVNHIEKRLGTALRKLVAERQKAETARKQKETEKNKESKSKGKKNISKEQSLSISGGKEGNLSEAKIMKLQSYYRNAIVDNIPLVSQMRNAVMATLEHYSSSDENPRHHLCPQGASSWCWYNKAIAQSLDSDDESEPPSHADHPVQLNERVVEAIRPIYERLSTPELMSKCIHGGTSNANEALHHCIWNRCPKTKFQSKKKLEVAVAYAISEFNMGCAASTKLLKQVSNETISEAAEKVAQQRDSARIYQSDASALPGANYKRKARKKALQEREKKRAKKEGVTYAAGLAGLEDTTESDADEKAPPKKKKQVKTASKPKTVARKPQPRASKKKNTASTPKAKPVPQKSRSRHSNEPTSKTNQLRSSNRLANKS